MKTVNTQSRLLDRVGVVASIARYPVKSMQAELLETAAFHWPWLHGDRQYAFVKDADTSAFPWLTARDLPELVRFTACYERPDDPAHSAVMVTDPRGTVFDVRSPMLAELLSEATGAKVRLLRLGRGCFDAMAISMLTTTMVTAVGRVHGATVASERFRANLMIQPDEPEPTEPAWLGRSIAVGAEAHASTWDGRSHAVQWWRSTPTPAPVIRRSFARWRSGSVTAWECIARSDSQASSVSVM